MSSQGRKELCKQTVTILNVAKKIHHCRNQPLSLARSNRPCLNRSCNATLPNIQGDHERSEGAGFSQYHFLPTHESQRMTRS